MYSMCISLNQLKYFEWKNVLSIAVYVQTLGKSFAGQLVLRGQPVLSFDMLPFPKGDCLIQVWLCLLCSSSSAHSWKKNIYHLLLINHTAFIFSPFTHSFVIIRRVYIEIWHEPIFLLLYQVTQLIHPCKIDFRIPRNFSLGIRGVNFYSKFGLGIPN